MTVEAIKNAILALSEQERLELEDWLADEWDKEMERDFSPDGRGAALVEEIDADIVAGKFRPLGERRN